MIQALIRIDTRNRGLSPSLFSLTSGSLPERSRLSHHGSDVMWCRSSTTLKAVLASISRASIGYCEGVYSPMKFPRSNPIRRHSCLSESGRTRLSLTCGNLVAGSLTRWLGPNTIDRSPPSIATTI
jgi:hypothetical protein